MAAHRILLAAVIFASACLRTEIVRAPVSTPDETAYGTEMHVLNAGLVVQRTIATGIAGSTPAEAGPRNDGVWRLVDGGLEVEYCESGAGHACQRVSTGSDRNRRRRAPFVVLDPVNRGAAMTQTTTTTPEGQQTTTTGGVAIGSITAPFTAQRGAWLGTSAHDELVYCSAPDGRPVCAQAPVGGPIGSGFFTARLPIQVLSVHVVQDGTKRTDVVWVVHMFQYYRCAGGADAPTPTCKLAKVQ